MSRKCESVSERVIKGWSGVTARVGTGGGRGEEEGAGDDRKKRKGIDVMMWRWEAETG